MEDSGPGNNHPLSIPQALLLGFQHLFAMFGATVLVPVIVAGYYAQQEGSSPSVQMALFCAGGGTLLFHIITRGKVPAFLGSSFAFLGGYAAVAKAGGAYASACGGIVVAGLLYLVLAVTIRIMGANRVIRYLPPVVTGPIIGLTKEFGTSRF